MRCEAASGDYSYFILSTSSFRFMSHYEDLNTTKIALVGFISTVVVFAIILFMIVLFHWEMAEQTQVKVIDQPAAEFDMLVADQKGQLAKYRWIDLEKKIVQIPIKDAMAMVVSELQKSPADQSTTAPTPPEAPPATPPEKEGKNAP
jgi:hypothetical protein